MIWRLSGKLAGEIYNSREIQANKKVEKNKLSTRKFIHSKVVHKLSTQIKSWCYVESFYEYSIILIKLTIGLSNRNECVIWDYLHNVETKKS